MGEHHWVVIHIDDARLRRHQLGNLVGVVGRWNTSPDIQKLADTCFLSQETHRPCQERPVSTRGQHDIRESLDRLLARGAVSGEIVLPAEPVVIHAGDVCHARVERWLAIVWCNFTALLAGHLTRLPPALPDRAGSVPPPPARPAIDRGAGPEPAGAAPAGARDGGEVRARIRLA